MYAEYTSRTALAVALNHPLLSTARERELLVFAKAGDTNAINMLIAYNQRLVASVVRRYNNALVAGDIDILDLFQAGNIGLYKAITMWDHSKEVKFSTYAFYWIRSHVRRLAIKKSSSLTISHSFAEKLVKIRRATSDIMNENERQPSHEDIVNKTGFTAEEVQISDASLSFAVSLEGMLDADGEDSIKSKGFEIADCEQATEEDACQKALIWQAQNEINGMPVKWRKILIEHFGLDGNGGKTMTEIAREMKVTRQYVDYIIKQGLIRLRQNMGSDKPRRVNT